MYKIFTFILFTLVFQACKNNKAQVREPIQHSRNQVDYHSVDRNKNLNKREENYIKKIIDQDTIHNYVNSGQGFWYYKVKENPKGILPKTNDWLTINYELKDLSNNTIYSSEEIGEKKYHVDHENYFRGFHEAIKLLREGEEAMFIFPSNSAYGYHGDEKRIGQNIPLKMKLKIIKIEKK